MVITSKTKLINEATTGEGVTFTLTEQQNETYLSITWANGEEALDYPLRIVGNDSHNLIELFKTA